MQSDTIPQQHEWKEGDPCGIDAMTNRGSRYWQAGAIVRLPDGSLAAKAVRATETGAQITSWHGTAPLSKARPVGPDGKLILTPSEVTRLGVHNRS